MVDVEIAGESTRAFQLQLKPHLQRHESQQTSQTTQSDHQELDISMEVIRSLAEMKPVVIVYEYQQLGLEQLKQGCEVVQATEATNLISKYGNTGYSNLIRGELKQALLSLRRADVILNALVASESNAMKEDSKSNQIDIDLVYFIKGNLGVCFYRAGLLEEAFTCFQTCGLALEKRATSPFKKDKPIVKVINTPSSNQTNNANSHNLSSPMSAIQKQMLVKFNFQSCILRSEQGKHERAIAYARKALSAVISQILELYASVVVKVIQKRNNPKRLAVTPRNLSSSNTNRQNSNSNNNQSYEFEDNNYYGFNLPTERSRQHSISFSTHTTRTLSSEESAKKIEQLYPIPRSLKSLEFEQINKSKVQQTDSNDRLLIEQKRARSGSIDQQQQSLKAFPQQQQHLLPYFPSKSQKNSLDSQERKDKSESDEYQSEEHFSAATLTREEKNLLMILKSLLVRCQDLGDLIADQDQFYFLTSIPLPFTESLTISQVFQSANNLLSKSNILSLLQLKPFSFSSLKNNLHQTTSISDKFAVLASQLTVSFYCLSTECRFIEQEAISPKDTSSKPSSSNRLDNYFSSSEISDSENYLSRALEIAFIYLPHDLPLVGQIVCVHSKFHAAFRQTIQEDTPDLSSHVLLRPLPGGTKFPQFIPLIRKRTEKQQQQQSVQENITNQSNLVNAIQNNTKQTLEQFSDTPIYAAEGLSRERTSFSKRQPLLEKNKSALNSIISNGNNNSNMVQGQQRQSEKSEQVNKGKITTNEKDKISEQYPISKELESLSIRRAQLDGSRADSGISVRSELDTADKDKKKEQIEKTNQSSAAASSSVKVRKQLFKTRDDFRETQQKQQRKESQQQQQLQLLEQQPQQEEQQNQQTNWRINLQQSILQRRQNLTLDPPSSTRNKKRSSEEVENNFIKPKLSSNLNNLKVLNNQHQRDGEVKASLKYLNNFLKNPQQVPQRILNPSHLGVKNAECNFTQQTVLNNHKQQQKTEQFVVQSQNVNANHQSDMHSQAEKHQQQLNFLNNAMSDFQQQPPLSFRSKQKTPTLQIQNNISFFLSGSSNSNNSSNNNSFIKPRGTDTPVNPPQSASSRSSPEQTVFNNTSKAFPKVFTQFKPNTTNFARDQYFNYLSKEQRIQGGQQIQRQTDHPSKNINISNTQKQTESSNKPKQIQIPFLSIQNSPNSSFTQLSKTINISINNNDNAVPSSKAIPHSARSKDISSGTQTPLRIRRHRKQQPQGGSIIQEPSDG